MPLFEKFRLIYSHDFTVFQRLKYLIKRDPFFMALYAKFLILAYLQIVRGDASKTAPLWLDFAFLIQNGEVVVFKVR